MVSRCREEDFGFVIFPPVVMEGVDQSLDACGECNSIFDFL